MANGMHRQASGGCDDEHSWAWISPTGEFYEVANHAEWALANRKEETYAEALSTRPYRKSLYNNNERIFSSFLHAAVFDNDAFLKGPPKDLFQLGRVYQIPDDVRRRAEARGLPTLSMGSWALRTRLTPAEERFLASEGVYPEVVDVDRDNAWNRKVMKVWKEKHSDFDLHTRSLAEGILEREGWIKVSNAYGLGGLQEPTPKQWASFFRNVVKCWKAMGIRPPVEKEKLFLSVGSRYEDMTYDAAIDIYCPRDVQDEIFEYLLGGRPSPTFSLRQQARADALFDDYVRRTGIDPRTVSGPVDPSANQGNPAGQAKPQNPMRERKNPMRERKQRERYPTRRASAERVAARYLTAAPLDDYHSMPSRPHPSTRNRLMGSSMRTAYRDPCDPSGQGVAWISPEGRWFVVPDGIGHGTWALHQVVHHNGLFALTGDWRGFVRDQKAVAAIDRVHRGEPGQVTRTRFLSVPMGLRAYRGLMSVLNRHGVEPGTLPPDFDEYKLISDVRNLGRTFDKVTVIDKERENPEWKKWDAARRDLEPGGRTAGVVADATYEWMTDTGWVRVANVWNLSFRRGGAPVRAMDTWCERAVRCIRPGSDVERLSVYLDHGGRVPLVEFVERSCSPAAVSMFWDHLMGGNAVARVATAWLRKVSP